MTKIKKCYYDETSPELGSVVLFYDEYLDGYHKGVIVGLSIEDYEDEIYNDEGDYEEILVEYLVFIIANKSGIHYSDSENVYLLIPPTIKNI